MKVKMESPFDQRHEEQLPYLTLPNCESRPLYNTPANWYAHICQSMTSLISKHSLNTASALSQSHMNLYNKSIKLSYRFF